MNTTNAKGFAIPLSMLNGRVRPPVRALPIDDLLRRPIPGWKRAIDCTGALIAIILGSPLILLAAALIKTVSSGPLLFTQPRVGYGGKIFKCYKFRTMYINADASIHQRHVQTLRQQNRPAEKLDNSLDPRILPMAKILRCTGIDELPQLINVLRGEMSLVGPRPCVAYEAAEFQPWERRRFQVLPGLTGLWQVNGKNRTTITQMIRYDLQYVQALSLWTDIEILFRTPLAVLQLCVDAYRGTSAETAKSSCPVTAETKTEQQDRALRAVTVEQ